jgi:hypothetical protein
MIKRKLINEGTAQKLSKIGKFLWNWILVIMISVSTFFLGYYYPRIKNSINGEKISSVLPKTSEEITISVTDRGELMMMNRRTRVFEIYKEEVGLNVFKAYANRMTEGKK